METYYERYGEGPPLVCLHGATSEHQLWKHQVEALRDEYEVITYDLRGHGKTGGSDFPQYTVDLYADDLHALVQELGLESPRICGLSLGGMVALTYAARYTDQVSALAVAGTLTPEPQTLKERAVMEGLYPVVLKGVRLLGYERIQFALRWVSERIGDTDVAELESEAERLRDEEITLDDDEYYKIMGAGVDYVHSPVRLENISVPTLVMYGEDEPFVPNHTPIYRRRISDVRAPEIPDAAHNSHIQNPEAFTTALEKLLREQVEVREVPE